MKAQAMLSACGSGYQACRPVIRAVAEIGGFINALVGFATVTTIAVLAIKGWLTPEKNIWQKFLEFAERCV